MIEIYGIENCSTCKKAIKSLQKQIKFIDLKKDNLPKSLLIQFYNKYGVNLLNKKSLTWRNLSEEEKKLEILILLSNYPLLLKRPLIKNNNELFIGWDIETEQSLKE